MSTNKEVSSRQWNKILISQPKPASDKSPYFTLAKEYDIEIIFHPFIKLEGITTKEFRKQKIEISDYSAIIFTSKNAIEYFFKICEEMKISINQEMKYFCITEAVALYLQKFILYRKRKVFFGADGSVVSLIDVISKHKDEKFLFAGSENQDENTVIDGLIRLNCDFTTVAVFRIISNQVVKVLKSNHVDIICIFTPSGVKNMLEEDPEFEQRDVIFAAFGEKTKKALEEANFKVDIYTPTPEYPSMASALEGFLSSVISK